MGVGCQGKGLESSLKSMEKKTQDIDRWRVWWKEWDGGDRWRRRWEDRNSESRRGMSIGLCPADICVQYSIVLLLISFSRVKGNSGKSAHMFMRFWFYAHQLNSVISKVLRDKCNESSLFLLLPLPSLDHSGDRRTSSEKWKRNLQKVVTTEWLSLGNVEWLFSYKTAEKLGYFRISGHRVWISVPLLTRN